jgi:chromate transporter
MGQAVVHGLKLVALAVVAQGVLNMTRTLAPDATRALMAAAAAALIILSNSAWMQLFVVAAGAVFGFVLCRNVATTRGEAFTLGYGRRTGSVLILTFGVLLAAALLISPKLPPLGQLAGSFYRAGALVFGGGHVVLPLLKQTLVDPGWLDNDTFLAGYGAAQAVPGPMFSVATFIGARVHGGQLGALGALVSLVAIFLPGLMLMSGVLPFWGALGARENAARMVAGVNAAVVGLLMAALYNPVWVSAIQDSLDFAIAATAFALLTAARLSTLSIVGWCVGASLLRVAGA